VAIKLQWPGRGGGRGIKFNLKIFRMLNHNRARAGTAGSSQLFLIHSSSNFSLFLSVSVTLYIFCFVSFPELLKAGDAALL